MDGAPGSELTRNPPILLIKGSTVFSAARKKAFELSCIPSFDSFISSFEWENFSLCNETGVGLGIFIVITPCWGGVTGGNEIDSNEVVYYDGFTPAVLNE
jgi:hypothetical protein